MIVVSKIENRFLRVATLIVLAPPVFVMILLLLLYALIIDFYGDVIVEAYHSTKELVLEWYIFSRETLLVFATDIYKLVIKK